jgi:hypothetical protein
MKKLKLFALSALAIATIAMVGCKKNNDAAPDVPSGDDPVDPQPSGDEPDYASLLQDGKGVVVIHVASEEELGKEHYCNGIGMHGSNGGEWTYYSPFEAIEGFEDWYYAIVDLGEAESVNSNDEMVAYGGHPCLYNKKAEEGGIPDWKYEWSKGDEVVLLYTTDEVAAHYTGENVNFTAAGLIALQVNSWVATPCVPAEIFDATVKVKTPQLEEGYTVWLTGAFEKSEEVPDGWTGHGVELTPNSDRTEWTGVVEQVEDGSGFKATLGDWASEPMQFKAANEGEEGEGCWEPTKDFQFNDVNMEVSVANFKNLIDCNLWCSGCPNPEPAEGGDAAAE